MKKLLCIILSLLLTVSVFGACSGKKQPDASTGEKTSGEIESNDPGTQKKPLEVERFGKDGQPETFNIMVRADRYDYLWWDDADTKDAVQRSVIKRNDRIEELYNVIFSISEVTDSAQSFTTMLTGGSGEFDLVCFDYWWKLEQNGFFYDLSQMQEIDMSDSYWYSGWNNNATINGVSYTIVGDANLEVLQNIEVMFFNKSIAQNYDLDLYQTVNDGNWTLEELMRVNTLVARNLDDGDPSNDIYGALYDRHSMRSQLVSAGLKVTSIAENGAVDIIANTPQNVNICDDVTRMINSEAVNFVDINTRVRDYSIFQAGNSLFYATALLLGKTLKSLELSFDYGVIVPPKYDKEAEYISTNYGASVFGIPLDVRDRHMSAMILNAMNYLSDETVVYTFYEEVMKGRVSDAPEDAEMIDRARNNMYMDFAFVYDIGLLGSFYTAVINKTSVSTELAGTVTSAREKLVQLIENFHQ